MINGCFFLKKKMDFILTSFNFNKKVGVHIFQTKINKYKELRFTKLYNPRF